MSDPLIRMVRESVVGPRGYAVEQGEGVVLFDKNGDPIDFSQLGGGGASLPSGAFADSTLMLEDGEMVWRTRRGGLPQTTPGNFNEVNDLIDWAQNHGKKYIALDERDYDNSSVFPTFPVGFQVHGAGKVGGTRILLPTSGEQARVYGSAIVKDLRFEVKNPEQAWAFGTSPNPSGGGIKMYPKAKVDNCVLAKMHIAFNLWGDHIFVHNCDSEEIGAALFRSANGQTRGNLELISNRFTGCAIAAFFVVENIEEDSLNSEYNDFSFSPYGWFANNSGGGQNEFAFTNVQSRGDSFESLGYRGVQLGKRKISGTMWGPRTGPNDTDYAIPGDSGGTWGSLLMGANQQYTFTSGNVNARDAASNDGQFSIQGDFNPPDTSNGPFITPGTSGDVFEVVT